MGNCNLSRVLKMVDRFPELSEDDLNIIKTTLVIK